MGQDKTITPWELALQDPHLMRLGDYLATQLGEDAVARLKLETEAIRWKLEAEFLQDPWQEGLIIKKVVDPNFIARPFVLLWTIKSQDHSTCPLDMMQKKGEMLQHSEEKCPKAKVPEQPDEKEVDDDDTKRERYKPWEKYERGGRLQGIFKWKKYKEQEQTEKGDDQGSKVPKAGKVKNKLDPDAHKCKEKITKEIRKVLLSTYKPKCKTIKSKKVEDQDQMSGRMRSGWQGPRPPVSEEPQKKKKIKSREKRKKLASNNPHSLIGGAAGDQVNHHI